MGDSVMQAPQQSIERSVIEVVEDLTQDWGLEADDIDGNTMLVEHLDFASVDIIQLCVALEQHYDRKLGFRDLLLVDGSYVHDLSIAQIANFVASRIEMNGRAIR
jgi:acyl carrier protein